MWFNGACVGLQASEWVLVFWAPAQMLRVFKGKSVSTHEPFKSSSWLFPSSSAGWIAALCLALPPLEMGEKWALDRDELFSPAGLQTQGSQSLAHGSPSCSPRKTVSHTLVSTPGALMDTSEQCLTLPKIWAVQHYPRAAHGAGSRHRFCSALGTAPTDIDWDVPRELSLKLQIKVKISHVSPSSHCTLQQSLHQGDGGLVRDEKEHVSKWNHAAGE